ncbi:MAG: hypothetical protein L3J69_01350 [Desulfobacula sp.]|nr:hypothetical protein [Desulfobacula sp.]
MKITDPDVIKNGEKDLIEAVQEDLDLDTVKKILEKRMAASTLLPDGGEIIVHNNEIAFRMNFNIHLSGSLMFDRQGNYIPDSDETGDIDDTLSQDLNLNDIDIEETLEEVGPGTVLNQEEQFQINPDTQDDDSEDVPKDDDPVNVDIEDDLEDEDLNIDLPDYSLDDDETIESDQDDDLLKLDELISDEDSRQLIDDDLNALNELDSEELDLSEESDPEVIDTSKETEVQNESQVDDLEDDDLIDDDISDILKDSRNFWEQKKGS